MRLLYTVLLYLLTPLALLRLAVRGLRLRDYWWRWGERFGLVVPAAEPTEVWVHAVSVGESLAAMPMIRELVDQYGPGRVWVTTTTPTGSARVRESLGDAVRHSYFPYDLPGSVRRAMRRIAPRRIVIMETELWPNLFRAARNRDVPLLVANARLSPRSFRGYSRVRGFAAETLQNCALIAAQSEHDAMRFKSLGAPRVEVMGNIKFDLTIPADQVEAGAELRERFGAARPVWIAASTHEGEEVAALDAHRELRKHFPDAVLILVPRHPQRFDTVWGLIDRSRLRGARRQWNNADADTEVLLGDSMGEMFTYLAASDVVFVGGSFAAIGGHNILEPAAIGKPVLFGPQMHNFLPSRELLLSLGAAVEVPYAAKLGPELIGLFGDAERRHRMGADGRAAIAANRGALRRLIGLLDGL
ncbi:MAG: lipid IV(A) 3-deoxy-D-manno-octulosonic acid transferase [Gammaproteobacteria bacterium]|nr:lipid IV(A) 3-deoxy-D-manno-octulosonic acid transferase [Gammaproteobacteria bacterium]